MTRGPRALLAEALYALAFLAAHIGFMPLMVLLLPRRVEATVAGDPVTSLSILLLAGGIVAGFAHILAGHWSDGWLARHGSRRGLIGIGATALALTYAALALAQSLPALFVAIIAYQFALNVMFAPLGALLADYIPDRRKGRVAGMLNAAMPLSYAAIALTAFVYPSDSAGGFILVAGLVVLGVFPIVILWPFSAATPVKQEAGRSGLGRSAAMRMGWLRSDFALAWGARFLVQMGAAFIFGYLYLYLETLEQDFGAPPGGSVSQFIGQISLAALSVSAIFAVSSGVVSDRISQRRGPLALLSLIFAISLAVMAAAPGWTAVMVAYAAFNGALAGFLSIDSALVAQLVASHPRRGALLGVMNLTNTLPGVVAAAIALLAVDSSRLANGFPILLFCAAVGAVFASICVQAIRSIR